MTIYPDKKLGKPTGKWVVEVTIQGKRMKTRVEDHKEAVATEARWKRGVFQDHDQQISTHERMLSELPRLCARDLWPDNPENIRNVERKVAWVVNALGDYPLSAVDYEWSLRVAERLREQGRSPATINRYIAALNPMFKHAYKSRWIASVPTFKYQSVENGRIRWLTTNEENELLRFLRENFGNVADFVTLAIDTGCRRSELLKVKPSMVVDGWLHLPAPITKTKHDRSIPLTKRSHEIAKHALPWNLSLGMLRYAWERAAKHMGLSADRDFVLHCCRHTCATRLSARGVPIVAVMQWMGHTDIKTTQRYAHVTPDMLLGAVAKLEGE